MGGVGAAEESGAVPTRLHKCGTNSSQAVWIAGLCLFYGMCVYVRLTCVVAAATLKIRRWPLKTNSLGGALSATPSSQSWFIFTRGWGWVAAFTRAHPSCHAQLLKKLLHPTCQTWGVTLSLLWTRERNEARRLFFVRDGRSILLRWIFTLTKLYEVSRTDELTQIGVTNKLFWVFHIPRMWALSAGFEVSPKIWPERLFTGQPRKK